MKQKPKLAIIGSGISGLACAHFLQHDYELTLFEKDDRIGGHSHTVTVPENGEQLPLDTGFMVYNEVTYPLLTRLFKDLGVVTKPTSMSFSVQHLPDDVEFNGGGYNQLFGQRKNLLRSRFWKMLLQINRFNKETVEELRNPRYGDLPLCEYVEVREYGSDFLRWYLSPMAAAVWSSPPERINSFPARTLMRFWHNHGFLGLDTQHPWRTVVGGSREYVKKVTGPFADRLRTSNGVASVKGREVFLTNGSSESFDKIIFAAHGDQSRSMLEDPTDLEDDILAPVRYQSNRAVVHHDESFMPRNKRCWASWNYRIEKSSQAGEKHSTHYWMNNLQGVSDQKNYFVSVNPPNSLDPEKIIRTLEYDHPVFTTAAVQAQARVPELHRSGQSTGRYYCGAWQRYGFHEDGIWSAYELCREILHRDPWRGGGLHPPSQTPTL